MRPSIAAPLALIAGTLLLAASPVRAGGPPPPPPPPEDLTPAAVIYSVEAGLILLVPSGFDLSDFRGDPVPSDLSIVDLDDLTHGTSDAFAITQICVADPACRDSILGSGPGGRQSLVDAVLDVYGSIPTEPPFDVPVPEPATASLLALGLGTLAVAGRRRRVAIA